MPSPEEVAVKDFQTQCHIACSQFYNDGPDKSLKTGCDLLEGIFGESPDERPIECLVKPGMDDYPTKDAYIAKTLISADGLVVDTKKFHIYEQLLGPEYEELIRRVERGEITLAETKKPVTFESYRRRYGDTKDAILNFVRDTVGFTDPEELFDDIRYACVLESGEKNVYTLRRKNLTKMLLERGYATRLIDAQKIVNEIMKTVEWCKVGEEQK